LLYGFARLPGGLTQFLLWAGIPLVLVHWNQTTEVALANAVTSLVNLPVLVLSPLAFVLLPRLSLAQVQGEDLAVQGFLRKGLRVAWELQLPATGTLLLFLEPALNLWLGFPSHPFLETGRWMVAAIPGLSIFMFLRPATDARSMVPYAVLAQGGGILLGMVWLLVTPQHHRSVDLGRAFFIAQTTAALILGFWCMKLHSMRPQVRFGRLTLQLLPLLVGALLVGRTPSLPGQGAIWSAAMVGYAGALLATTSPILSPLTRLLKRNRP
jgi:O-antigen/teichoic acid export membrane protein